MVFFFLSFYGCTHGQWKFLGQELDPSCSCDLRHTCSNPRSLAHCDSPLNLYRGGNSSVFLFDSRSVLILLHPQPATEKRLFPSTPASRLHLSPSALPQALPRGHKSLRGWAGSCWKAIHTSLLMSGRNSPFSTLSGSVPGDLQIKRTKDRFFTGAMHAHAGVLGDE